MWRWRTLIATADQAVELVSDTMSIELWSVRQQGRGDGHKLAWREHLPPREPLIMELSFPILFKNKDAELLQI